MATQDSTTSPTIAQLATEQADLPRTALLGIFGTASAPRALVRLRKGDTKTVGVGDRVAGSTVAAIADDYVTLSRNGAAHVLRMPQS